MRLVVTVVLRFNRSELIFSRGSPDLSSTFATHHDASLRRSLSNLLGLDPNFLLWNAISLPLHNIVLLARPTYWASWADCLR